MPLECNAIENCPLCDGFARTADDSDTRCAAFASAQSKRVRVILRWSHEFELDAQPMLIRMAVADLTGIPVPHSNIARLGYKIIYRTFVKHNVT